jgi:hypothetical protein
MVVSRHFVKIYHCLLLLVAMTAAMGARAGDQATASVQRIEPLVMSGQLMFDVDLNVELNDKMKQVLSRGVPLTFSLELEISAPRWWWFDRTIVDTTLERRLSYNTLTRIWRVTTGDFSVSAASYEDAMKSLSNVRQWPVVLSDRFEPDQTYIGAIRLRLDSDQLARPLQMDTAREQWSLSSPWKSFDFSIRRNPEGTP